MRFSACGCDRIRVYPRLSAVAVVLLAALLAACTDPSRDPKVADLGRPTDFAVEVFVLQERSGGGRATSPAKYVVDADRTYRAASGPGTTRRTYPKPVRRLTPREAEALWRVVNKNHLLSEPISPLGKLYLERGERETAMYVVSITARRRVHTFATTPRESTSTAAMVRHLEQWREDLRGEGGGD